MTRLLLLTALLIPASLIYAQPLPTGAPSLAERRPNDPALWLTLATEQFAQGDFEAAAASARQGIGIDRSHALLYRLLGYAEWASGNLMEADLAFRSYIRFAPDKLAAQAAYREFRDWNVGLIAC